MEGVIDVTDGISFDEIAKNMSDLVKQNEALTNQIKDLTEANAKMAESLSQPVVSENSAEDAAVKMLNEALTGLIGGE